MSDHDPKTILRSIPHTELATLAPEAVEDRIGRLVKSSVQPFIEMSKKVAELNKQLSAENSQLSAENSQLKDGTFVADAGERIAQLTQAKAELEERVRWLEERVRWFEERIKLVTIHPAEVFEWTGTREGYASSKNYQSRAPVVMERSVGRAAPPRPAKNQAKRTSRAADAGPRRVTIDGLEIDARDPRNATPCTAPRYTGRPPKSPAAAARARREAMAQCACRLCALALHPPLTFAEHRAFCGQIVDESMEREIFGAPRVLRAIER